MLLNGMGVLLNGMGMLLNRMFQPLRKIVSKPTKSFIANKYNALFVDEVTKQLVKGIKPADVKVSLALRAAGITETVEFAYSVVQRIEYFFQLKLATSFVIFFLGYYTFQKIFSKALVK